MKARRSQAPAAFAEEIDGFIGFLELERGLSARTTESYQGDLDQCAKFLAGHHVAAWRAAQPKDLSDWIYALSGDDYTVASLARKFDQMGNRDLRRYPFPPALLAGYILDLFHHCFPANVNLLSC